MKREIAVIRKDYQMQSLSEGEVFADAIEQFNCWWNNALDSEIEEVNAMTLATASKDGLPHARIVLLKDYDERGFVFFTNYDSQKGKELEINPHAALILFWKELERQIRIEGNVQKISIAESDIYFNSRPAGSKIGAWASPQSAVIENRNLLDERADRFAKQFGNEIPRPPYWGGYRVIPVTIEFWQGRSNRLHDRIRYTKGAGVTWKIDRLAP